MKKQLSEKLFFRIATGHRPLGKIKRNHNRRSAEPPTHRSRAKYLYYKSTLPVWESGIEGTRGESQVHRHRTKPYADPESEFSVIGMHRSPKKTTV